MTPSALSVKQLNFYVKNLIEGDPRLSGIAVVGEISNLKSHFGSGHIYFTLKDSDAAVSCVMFRSNAARLKFIPENGQQVMIIGRVSVYEKDGRYQIYAEEMRDAGLGDIARRFEQTKAKLEAEGLFKAENKRPIPKFPKKIAVVTSESGAAVRDILNILSRRFPIAQVLMCPVSVQGEFAVPEMLNTLEYLYTLEGIDLIIIGRGGGSAEDLWAFNDEKLAYKIYESPFPVISAVGHETDFTICDFVADLRAPTPSAAAELAVPDSEEILNTLKKQEALLYNQLIGKLENCKLKFQKIISAKELSVPLDMVSERYENVDRLLEKMTVVLNDNIQGAKLGFAELTAKLDTLSPLKTLSRGFAAVGKENKPLQSVKELKRGDFITVSLSDGSAECQVEDIKAR